MSPESEWALALKYVPHRSSQRQGSSRSTLAPVPREAFSCASFLGIPFLTKPNLTRLPGKAPYLPKAAPAIDKRATKSTLTGLNLLQSSTSGKEENIQDWWRRRYSSNEKNEPHSSFK